MRFVVAICAVIGGLFLATAPVASSSAPQQAALAAIACAFAVVPYVIWRADQLAAADKAN